MRLNMEQTILSQYRRLPGFHSEFMGLEIMNETMTTVGVEDILNGTCRCRFIAWSKARITQCLSVPRYTGEAKLLHISELAGVKHS